MDLKDKKKSQDKHNKNSDAKKINAERVMSSVAHFLLNTKFHFVPKAHHFFKKACPYIRKNLFRAVALGAFFVPVTSVAKTNDNPKTNEVSLNETASRSFKDLYNKSRGLIFKSMMPTEILVCEPYADNGKQINTIGVGNYYFPENGDPTCPKWMLTSLYLKKHPELKRISGEQAYELTNGWFCYRKKGQGITVYDDLEQRLKDTHQQSNQIAAIADCYYNSEVNGNKLCAFIQKNWKDPFVCAQYLANFTCKNPMFKKGIAKRHAFEALLYLNPNNFADKLDYLFVKERLNKDDKKCYTTSMSILTDDDLKLLHQGLAKKDMKKINIVAERVLSYFPTDAESIRDIVNKHGLTKKLQQTSIDAQAEATFRLRKKLITQAQNNYKHQNYTAALSNFQSLLNTGAHSADIHNYMALACYFIKDYESCQKHCDDILKTNQVEFYTSDYLIQAKLCELQGNKMQATANHQMAEKYGNDKKIKAVTESLTPKGFYKTENSFTSKKQY